MICWPVIPRIGNVRDNDPSQMEPIAAAYASDLQRASETALIIAAQLGIGPVVLEPGLRERDAGEWSGLTRAEIEERYPGWLTPLADRRCVPCEAGTPPLAPEAWKPLLDQLEGWEVRDGVRLVKEFRFKDFLQAVAFVNRITPIAEDEGHHPDLQVGWGRVLVELTTHAAKGLTENDFVLAAKIDRDGVSDRPE